MQFITKQMGLLAGALVLIAGVTTANAEPRHRVIVVGPRAGFYHPYVYHPVLASVASLCLHLRVPVLPGASIRTKIDPHDTEIFVDGYFAGYAREFDGGKPLRVTPGGHAISMHLDGYRTVTEDIWVEPSKTVTLKTHMERLAKGEASAPVPAPASGPEPR